jgi:hypothetical protein
METDHIELIENAIKIVKEQKRSPRVKHDLIGNYQDFLREKRYLSNHYNFNLSVFNSLIKLADELWNSGKRFNRYALLNTMKQYLKRGNYRLDNPTKINLFELIKKIFAAKKLSNSLSETCFILLRNFWLSAEYEKWLCEIYEQQKSEILLWRILGYPVASPIITEWISEHFQQKEFRMLRYKAVAWLLNENPDYVIDNQILISDFEFLNKYDASIIQDTYSDYPYGTPIIFTDIRSRSKYHYSNRMGRELISRPYCSIVCMLKKGETPDFMELQNFFTKNLAVIRNQTMLWAVVVSKLPTKKKNKLLKKYYSPACFRTLLSIARRYQMLSILEWLKKQDSEESIFREIELGGKTESTILDEMITRNPVLGTQKMNFNEEFLKLIRN